MTLYDPKKQSLIVNGINITHWGESMVDRNYGGNYVEGRKGMQGDASTNALYNQMETFTITLLPQAPILTQVKAWAKNHTQLSLQYTDTNEGCEETASSNTAYVQEIGNRTDGNDRTITFYCEQVDD